MPHLNRTLAILVPLTVLASALPAAETKPAVREVIIAFKTHFDIGYTDMAANVVQRYRTSMIEQALGVCDRSRGLPPEQQFVWTVPGWPMSKILDDWPGQTPERKARVEKALKDGRFVVHALPFTTHTESLELEDLVRGMGYSSRIARSLGLDLPRDAKMTDVASHSWIIPTLLKNAGVDFLHLGCNAACSSPDVPPLFWWEGPDGSRVLTMYSAGGYGTGLALPGDWPYKAWLALIHTGDNHGPPTPEEVSKLLEDARKQLPGVKVRIGRLSDFADSILADKPQIPVVRGDMPDTWIHGMMCDPAGAKIARNIRPAISIAEGLGTLLDTWGIKHDPAAPGVAAVYEKSLLYGEHTWGGALYWVTSYSAGKVKFGYGDVFRSELAQGRFKRLEASWAEHTGYIESVRDLVTPLLDSEIRALAMSAQPAGQRIVVYNPLPWMRSGMVTVRTDMKGIEAVKPTDGDDARRVDLREGNLSFLARDIPAMGYRTYIPALPKGTDGAFSTDEKQARFEGPHFKLTLDPARGAITSLIDKRTSRELVDASAPTVSGSICTNASMPTTSPGFCAAM